LHALRQKVRRELLTESQKHKAIEMSAADSLYWLDPCCTTKVADAGSASLRQQAAALDLQWFGDCDACQCCPRRYVGGQLHAKKPQQLRGLNHNHNHQIKEIFKSTATSATRCAPPFQHFLCEIAQQRHGARDGRLTLARKIAAITLTVWKKGARFDATQLEAQAAPSIGEQNQLTSPVFSWRCGQSVLTMFGFGGEYLI
jgi:hypothetical protein